MKSKHFPSPISPWLWRRSSAAPRALPALAGRPGRRGVCEARLSLPALASESSRRPWGPLGAALTASKANPWARIRSNHSMASLPGLATGDIGVPSAAWTNTVEHNNGHYSSDHQLADWSMWKLENNRPQCRIIMLLQMHQQCLWRTQVVEEVLCFLQHLCIILSILSFDCTDPPSAQVFMPLIKCWFWGMNIAKGLTPCHESP